MRRYALHLVIPLFLLSACSDVPNAASSRESSLSDAVLTSVPEADPQPPRRTSPFRYFETRNRLHGYPVIYRTYQSVEGTVYEIFCPLKEFPSERTELLKEVGIVTAKRVECIEYSKVETFSAASLELIEGGVPYPSPVVIRAIVENQSSTTIAKK